MLRNYKKKIIDIYVILAFIILAALKKQYVVPSMYLAFALVLIFYVLFKMNKLNIQAMWKSGSKTEKYITGVLTVLGLLMLGILECRKSGLFDFSNGVSIVRLVYICGLIAIVIPTVVLSLYVLVFYWMNTVKVCEADTARPDEREMKLSMGIIILGVILFVSSAYPGIFHGDGTNVLRYVLAGRWSDWHPITYYAFVYLCMAVIKHPFMVILVQSVLFVFTQYIVLKFLKTYARKCACYIYTGIVFTVGISTLTYLYVFYKDTPHFIGILGFVVSLLAYVKGSRKKKDLLLVLFYAFFTACMRHMSVVIVLVTMLAAVCILLKGNEKKSALYLLVGSIVVSGAFYGMKTTLITITDTQKNPKYVSYTVPLHMLGSYAASDKTIDEETVELMNEIMPIDMWKEGYLTDPYFADTLSRDWQLIGDNLDKIEEKDLYMDILTANWRYLCRYPVNYLTDFFTINSLVWEMTTPIDGYEWIQSVFVNGDNTLVTKFPEYDVQHTFVTGLMAPILTMSKTLPIWKMISYRGGFFNFLVLCSGIALFQGKKQKEDWIAVVPVVLSSGLLMISLPAQDPRFVLPAIAIGCFVMAYAPNRLER